MSPEPSVIIVDGAFFAKVFEIVKPATGSFIGGLEAFCNAVTPRHHWRFRTYFIDAFPYKRFNRPTEDEKRNYKKKQEFFASINRLERFTVRKGYCILERHVDTDGQRRRKITQKMVDVLFSTELTRAAWSGETKHITIIAGDGDFEPAVVAAQEAGAIIRLHYANRGRTKTSTKLFDVVDERVDLCEAIDKFFE